MELQKTHHNLKEVFSIIFLTDTSPGPSITLDLIQYFVLFGDCKNETRIALDHRKIVSILSKSHRLLPNICALVTVMKDTTCIESSAASPANMCDLLDVILVYRL